MRSKIRKELTDVLKDYCSKDRYQIAHENYVINRDQIYFEIHLNPSQAFNASLCRDSERGGGVFHINANFPKNRGVDTADRIVQEIKDAYNQTKFKYINLDPKPSEKGAQNVDDRYVVPILIYYTYTKL